MPASQVTPQVKLLIVTLTDDRSRKELQSQLNLSDREYFRLHFLQPAIELGFIGMTIPNKPKSSNQKYFLTEMGKEIRNQLLNET
ncbi:Fic family protein [Sphingobacterium sp. ML3W]|uniref:Fic family protein n=1 Tax=Sphingobacterium sp. ML3W TaxID=1538644 RepID=UPI00118479BD|nr:hypothetical protein [Sphingobacterium sp. ML3W]